ncbi:hypothetical protein [Streptomyces sp. NPDC056291]|uniref:DUF7169 domain-containing protein n=1 Tax=Streptomyces sp. NPDC056291 TaxID=3345772 RepID=UPI0035E31F67
MTTLLTEVSVTYSPDHVADGQKLSAFLDALQRDVDELRHFLTIYDEAVTMPGRYQSGGGGSSTAPVRPTERVALDDRRCSLQLELNRGVMWMPRAIAIVRGVTSSMDRTLADWEGESAHEVPGGLS